MLDRLPSMRLHDMSAFTFLIKRFRWALLAAAVASVLSGTCSVVLLAQINAALTSDSAQTSNVELRFAATAVAMLLAGMFSRVLFERLRQRISLELRRFISTRVMKAPYRQLEQLGSSSVHSALSEHTTRVVDFFVTVPTLLSNGAMVVACLFYLVILSPRIFLVTLPFVVLGALGYHFANLQAIKYLRAGTAEQERLFEHFRSLTDGAKELRLNSTKRDIFRERVLYRSLEDVRRQRTTGMSLFVLASSWGNFLVYAFLGMVLFVIAGELSDRARVLTGFALVMVYLVGPLQALLLALPGINLAKVAAEMIELVTRKLESTEGASSEPASAAVVEPFQTMALRGVKHRYYQEHSDEFFDLGPIDLTFQKGEVTFIVGGNGSGKTTLAKLLVGLYPPEQGAIALNDVPVDDSNRDRYRQQFSAIFADFHLFDSLWEQNPASLDARGNRLLARFNLQHKVQVRNGAFSTKDLSSGQRKRLALVAAYLEDRPVLVFDEWAADQDPAFKEVFYYEILDELRQLGKLVIVISHDDRYFHVADRIVRLENGRVLSEKTLKPVSKPRLCANQDLAADGPPG